MKRPPTEDPHSTQAGTRACEEAAEAGRAQYRKENDLHPRGSWRFEEF